MKFVIESDKVEVEYKNYAFWQQFDELEVQNPKGWHVRYVEGGIVHSFGYSQSSGRGEYLDEYCYETYKKPLHFSNDAAKNAEIMKKVNYDGKSAVLIRE